MRLARRAFIAAFVLLGVAGALDHTLAEKLLGERIDLLLPHLKYGYVMFNQNPRQVQVYSYAGADGVRRDLADLVRTPAPLYKRARVAVNIMIRPAYLAELCYRASRRSTEKLTVFVDEYDLAVDSRGPQRTRSFPCDPHAILAQ